MKPFPKRKLVQVADAYRHGATYAEIKKKFGAGDGTIRRACKEFGIKLRGRGAHKTAKTTPTTSINAALQQANEPELADTLLCNIGCRFLRELEQHLQTKVQAAEARFESDGRMIVRYLPASAWKEAKLP
jgi:transposase-like protein